MIVSMFRRLPAGLAVCGLGFALCLGAAPAKAQFVCGGSLNGAEPQTGQGATATAGSASTACGPSADASGAGANTAFGQANASGDISFNTAVGTDALASSARSDNTAIGVDSNAIGVGQSVAVGSDSRALGDGSFNTAVGFFARATGGGSSNVAIGQRAAAEGAGTNNVAIGTTAVAVGTNSTAIGNQAVAQFDLSAAFGNGASADRNTQQAFGTAANTYTMSGIASAASRAAQSGPTQIVTSDAAGHLAATSLAGLGLASTSDINAFNGRLNGIDGRINGIDGRLDDLDNRSSKAFTGVAMAFAMAGVPTLLPSEQFAVSVNWGGFEGKNAAALAAALKLHDRVQLNGGVSFGINDGVVGARVGLRFGW